MTTHELAFRSDPVQEAQRIFELRELIRGNKQDPMPGPDRFIVEDLDLVLRWYGRRYDLDEWGRFRYVEVKRRGHGGLKPAQWRTFGMADSILRERPDRYDGFYVVTHSDDNHDADTLYTVNDVELSCERFLTWVVTPRSWIGPRRRYEIPRLPGVWT